MDTHAAAHALEPTDGPIMPEELQLASRNRGMPLEALRWDLTPTGLHYLLIHFDIPAVDPETWRLGLGGRVSRPLSLTLDELRARPRRTIPVTLECAGNGRGLLSPRPVSVPWLGGAIGTAEWTGTPLRELVEEAGLEPGAVELVFRGADRGIQGDDDQPLRPQPHRRGGRARRRAAGLRDERAAAGAAARLPAAPRSSPAGTG